MAGFQVLQRTKASTAAAATSLTVTLPAAATANSMQVLIVTTCSGSAITAAPAGWTQRSSDTVQSDNTYVFDHVTASTTDTSVTVSFASGSASAFLVEANGVIGFDVAAPATDGAGPSATYATGSLTPTTGNTWLVAVSASVTNATVSSSPLAVSDQQFVAVSGKTNIYHAYADGTTGSTAATSDTFTPAAAATAWETLFVAYKVNAPAYTGAVSLSGSGPLNLAGHPADMSSLSFPGSGSLTSGAAIATSAPLSLSGGGALTATPVGALALSGAGQLAASGAAFGYYFTGPSFLEIHPFRRYPPTRLFNAVPYGLTVWRDAQGAWHQQYAPTLDQLAGADRVYAGGRMYPMTDALQAELAAAGYSAYITLKGLP